MLWVSSSHGLVLITIYTSTYPRNSTLPQSDSITGLRMLCVYVSGVVRKCVCFASEVSIKKKRMLHGFVSCFRGLFISIKDAGHIYEMICNWPERNVKVICVWIVYFPSVLPSFFPPHFLPHQACFSQVLSSNTLHSPFSHVTFWSSCFFVSIFILPKRAVG